MADAPAGGDLSADEGPGTENQDKEIYNEKSAALADAVVAVDGGMGTGSMISDQGLMITNHHVAYSDICALSTPECNLLRKRDCWATHAR